VELNRLRPKTTDAERCPYCHDGLGEVERVACEGCGTPHHPACLAELGGCTVLGCETLPAPSAPQGPIDEIHARVRDRISHWRSGLESRQEPRKAVLARLAHQPPFCVECERELRSRVCPICKGQLQPSCAGDSVHCQQPGCREHYEKLARTRGAPIVAIDLRIKGRLNLARAGAALFLVLTFFSLVLYLGGASPWTPFLLVAVGLIAGLGLVGPLVVMMVLADRSRRDD